MWPTPVELGRPLPPPWHQHFKPAPAWQRDAEHSRCGQRGRGSRRGLGAARPCPGEALLSHRTPCPAPALMLKPNATFAMRHAPGHLPRHFQSGLCSPHGIDGDGEEGVPQPDGHSPGLGGHGVQERTGGPQGLLGPDAQTAPSRDPARGALEGPGVTLGFSEGALGVLSCRLDGSPGYLCTCHTSHKPPSRPIVPRRCGHVCSTVARLADTGLIRGGPSVLLCSE